MRRHGHSASIPHAFAPAALRALLASRGKPYGYPRRAKLGAPDDPEPAAPDRQVLTKNSPPQRQAT